MSEQTLTSLAILTVNWNHGADAIETFVPLVANSISKSGDSPVSLVDLQQVVEREAGIKIPSGALQAIVGRCAKRGLVQRRQKVFYPQPDKLAELDFGTNQDEALRQHRCLVDKLREFARKRYAVNWAADEAENYLLAFLQESSVPVLAAAIEGDPLPASRPQSRKARHVLSSFAGHVAEADPDGFECLKTVVKGHALSGVLFYPNVGEIQTRFDELDVYCDTPFLLRAIGYAEEGLHLQCLDLVELLDELGAHLKCFHHTREEVVGVLEAEAAEARSGANGTDYLTSRTFRLDEIEEIIARLDRTFNDLGIEVVDTPAWTDPPNEADLEEALKRKINYARDRAREKDVQSLAAVARLRKMRRVDTFETAHAIFVTTNTSLARASSTFFREIEGPGAIPVCMPVELMTRLAWVKKPLSVPDLPAHVVMASSYAALNPPTKLWKQYMTEIARRREKGDITDDEYHLLRSSREARRALMDETFGGEEAFSAGTLDEVLAHARGAIQAEAHAATEAERDQRLAAEQIADREREKRQGIERAHRDRIDGRARRFGAFIGWGVAGVIGLLVLLGALATVPGAPLVEIHATGLRIILWVCLGVFFALTLFATFIKGITVREMRHKLSTYVEARWRTWRHKKLDELHARASNAS